jgi:hypothetical protein
MTPDEIRQVAEKVTELAELFNRTISVSTLHSYCEALSDVPLEAIFIAIRRAKQMCKYMPVPCELRELAGEAQGADRAVLAWEAVLRAIGYGEYKHINFEDPAINATIRSMGGWPQLVSRFESAEAEKWVRKDFIQAYTSKIKHVIGSEEALPLEGLAQKQVVGGRVVDPVPVAIACRYASAGGLGYEQHDATQPALNQEIPHIELRKP